MREIALIRAPWRDPVEVAAAGAELDHAIAFLSDGSPGRGRWSYVLAEPAAVLTVAPGDPRDPFDAMRRLLGPEAPTSPDGPPFQGGLAGLLTYELGARLEAVGHRSHPDWPLLACGLYDAVLAFDHQDRAPLAWKISPAAMRSTMSATAAS